MAEAEIKKSKDVPEVGEFLTALYDDPIRPETGRRGRWLVGLSLTTIAITAFDAKLLTHESLPVSFPTDSHAIPGMLALVVGLLLIEYLFRCTTDLSRESELRLVANRYIAAQQLSRLKRSAQEADEEEPDPQREGYQYDPDPWWEPYIASERKYNDQIERLELRLGDRTWPRRIRLIRMVLEISFPAMLATLSLLCAHSQLYKFVGTTLAKAFGV